MKRNYSKAIFILMLVSAFRFGFIMDPALGGSVKPLPYGGSSKSEVNSLLPKENLGRVRPLPIEDINVRKVIAEGKAKIYNGDIERARIMALQAAYAEAVGRTCGVEIGSLTLIKNVKQISDVVMSRSKGFIKSYQVFSEGLSPSDEGVYEVKIEAEVIERGASKEDEKEGLKLYLKLLGNPRLLIMLPERRFGIINANKEESSSQSEIKIQDKDTKIHIRRQNQSHIEAEGQGGKYPIDPDQGSIMGSAEAAIAQAFSVYGYQVITADDLLAQGLVEPKVLMQAKSGVTAQAVKVARAAGADIAIFGIIRLSQNAIKPAGVSMMMVTAEASAKAMIVSSGKVIQAFHKTERASATNELMAYSDALDRVAGGIAEVLAWKIPHILTQESRETRLIIHDIDAARMTRLRDALSRKVGIEAVRFAKLPTANRSVGELILLSGFIRIPQEEIFMICRDHLGGFPSVIRVNKYLLEVKSPSSNNSIRLKQKGKV